MQEIRIKLTSNEVKIDESVEKPADVIKLMKKLIGDMSSEYYTVAYLDNNNRPLSFLISGIGKVNTTSINPTNTLQGALLQNATSIMLFHNHPSGTANPTQKDISATKYLVIAAKLIGIDVLDHVILTDKDYYSFAQNGILEISDVDYLNSLKEMSYCELDTLNEKYVLNDNFSKYNTFIDCGGFIYWTNSQRLDTYYF